MKTRLSGIALASFVSLLAGGPHAPLLSLEPTPSSITVGEVSTVDLRISDLGNFEPISVSAFFVEVTYDDTKLGFEGASYGSFLGDGFPDSDQVSPSASDGVVTLDEVSFLFNAELDALQPASFVLASITFRGAAAGVSELGFGLVELADTSFATELIDPELAPSSITVTSAVIPIPAALPLLGTAVAGLGFIGWRRRKAA